MLQALALTRAWWKAGVGILIGAILTFPVAYCSGHSSGIKAEKQAEAKRLEKAKAKVAKREKAADKITTNVSTSLEKQKVEIRWRTRTITEKVPVYVTAQADAACTLPVGFIRLHDAAASGGSASLPVAPGGSDEASGVALSDALGVVVGNYGTALEWRAEAMAWREWYQQQKAEWQKR